MTPSANEPGRWRPLWVLIFTAVLMPLGYAVLDGIVR